MKQIKYFLGGRSVTIGYSEENLKLAMEEADDGTCTIENDGQPEEQTPEQRIAQLEELLELLVSGATE